MSGNDDVVPGSGNVFTDLDLTVCGNCRHHTNEDANGVGWCECHDESRRCDDACAEWMRRQIKISA